MTAAAVSFGIPPRRRIWVTRVFCVAVIGLFLGTRSVWHDIGGVLPHVLTPLGIVLAAAGALGRLWCTSYAAGNKNSKLITAGPFSVTRNPLYFFTFIGGLGITITTETLLIPMLYGVWFWFYYRDVITGEEGYLRRIYDRQYEEYLDRVPRFWPRLSGYQEPETWTIKPASFRRSLSEVVWFVIAAILLHAVHDLNAGSILPLLPAIF